MSKGMSPTVRGSCRLRNNGRQGPFGAGMKTLMVALLLLFAAPAPALAATVETRSTYADGGRYRYVHATEVSWTAESSDRADATLVVGADRGVSLHDPSAPLRALTGCSADDAAAVRCPTTGVLLFVGRLGGGDDRVRLSVAPDGREYEAVTIDGGGGDDRIEAAYDSPGTLPLSLFGGAGDDTLLGGRGDDVLRGGPGADAIFGGAGLDVADHRDAAGPVAVDLAAGTGGERGEDRLTSVEGATGTEHADVLLGDDGDNVLDGGRGGDTIDGRAGDDTISVLGAAKRISCGPGRDRIVATRVGETAPRLPFPGSDCEQIALPRFTFTSFAAGPRSVRLTVKTINTYCSLTATLLDGAGKTIARARRSLWGSLRPTFALRARRTLPAGTRLEVVAQHCSKRYVPSAPTVIVLDVRPL